MRVHPRQLVLDLFRETMHMLFDELGLSEPICRAIRAEGYTTPTQIQSLAIPEILAGKDLLACARTGTGKTAAFALPVLHLLQASAQAGDRREWKRIKALVLSPTRELAQQTEENFRIYGKHTGLKQVAIVGGVHQSSQTMALKRGVDIVVATPGRLLDLIEQRFVDLSALQLFALDEADQMLDMGFVPAIRQILEKVPPTRQTLLFSATLPVPIVKLAKSMLSDPVQLRLDAEPAQEKLITQTVYKVHRQHKAELLHHLLATKPMTRTLVFTKTKRGADFIVDLLRESNIRAEAIHSNKSQAARQRTLANFRANKTPILVATDIAARGIDVDAISHVLNFDMPDQPETYLHRVGRTGRAGVSGEAISFCDSSERRYLMAIERHLAERIPLAEDHPTYSTPAPRDQEAGRREHRRPHAGARAGRSDAPRQHNDGPGHATSGERKPRFPKNRFARKKGGRNFAKKP